MPHYHQVKSIEDEQRLLSQIIHLETQIRGQKETRRLQKNSQNEKLAQIFEPITKTMQSLADVAPTKVDLITADDLITFPKPLKDEPLVPAEPLKDEPEEEEEEEEEDLYRKALQKIPKKSRDDGVFGLDAGRKRISDRPYSVEGNVLKVQNEDRTISEIEINDPNVWTILLAQNPSKIINLTDVKGQAAVEKYRDIVDELGLIPRVQFPLKNFKNRMKYKKL